MKTDLDWLFKLFADNWLSFSILYLVLAGAWGYAQKKTPTARIKHSINLVFVLVFVRFAISLASKTALATKLPLAHAGFIFNIAILTAFFVAILILADHLLWEVFIERRKKMQIPLILKDVVRFTIAAGVAALILKYVFGYGLTGLLATSAIFSAIIGFALQDMLGNIIAGIALQVEKPFGVGDWIEIGGQSGEVRSMSWRATRLKDINGNNIVVPNSQISKTQLLNYHKPAPAHAITVPIGVDYSCPPFYVKDTIMESIRQNPRILKYPEPKIMLTAFNDFSIDFDIKVWIDNHSLWKEVTDEIYCNLWYSFKRANISIPFPVRTVNLKNMQENSTPGTPESLEHLEKLEILKPLTPEQLLELARKSKLKTFGKAEVIISQNQEGGSLYVITSGNCQVSVDGKTAGYLDAGSVFGEMSLLTGEKTSATITAVQDTQVVEIGRAEFASILHDTPQIASELADMLAKRAQANSKLKEQSATPGQFANIEQVSSSFLTTIKNIFKLR